MAFRLVSTNPKYVLIEQETESVSNSADKIVASQTNIFLCFDFNVFVKQLLFEPDYKPEHFPNLR